MPSRIDVHAFEPHDGLRRKAGRSLVGIGVVVTLVLASAALVGVLGIERAAAGELGAALASDGGERLAVGAVLLAVFAGLCVLSTFMLRTAVSPELRPLPRDRRLG